jgi:hypothetical protein
MEVSESIEGVVKKGRGEGSVRRVEVAEWSKAVDSGSIPKGRGFKSHLQHFLTFSLSLLIGYLL